WPRSRGRRLPAQALRSARTGAADQQYPAPRRAIAHAEARTDRVWPLLLPDRATRTETWRGDAAADRARAGNPGDLRRARRRDDSASRTGGRRLASGRADDRR